ncbi:MAG: 16S rRNA (guanine(527)-N(7))-methyltransferase RsmG [Thermomicrobiales bacterium]
MGLASTLVPGIEIGQIVLLARYRDLILTANERFNLTAIRDPEGVEYRLLLESLRLHSLLASRVGTISGSERLIDVGSGSGIPGIPLAILFPGIGVDMIEATSKKARFIEESIHALGLANATVTHGRAEDLAREPTWRETRQIGTARAVGPISTLLELTMPFLEVGCRAVFPKGKLAPAELESGHRSAKLLGARLDAVIELEPLEGCPDTHVVLAHKIAPIADRYPRRSGLPARDPLGG